MRFRDFLNSLARELLHPVSKGTTILLSFYTILWGLWVVNPWWEVFSSADLYKGMREVAPEWVWGLFAVVCGMASLVTSVDNRYPRTLFTVSAITGWHWLIVSIMYFYGDWRNTGGITGGFLAFLCGFLYLRVKANRGFDR
jgi:hypothetical protein